MIGISLLRNKCEERGEDLTIETKKRTSLIDDATYENITNSWIKVNI